MFLKRFTKPRRKARPVEKKLSERRLRHTHVARQPPLRAAPVIADNQPRPLPQLGHGH